MNRAALRWLRFALAFVAIAVAAALLPVDEWLTDAASGIRSFGPAAPFVYWASGVIAAALFVPITPVTIGAGWLFGFELGLAVAWLVSVSSSSLSFLLGRHLLRPGLRAAIARKRRLSALHTAIGEEGWRLIALLRLSPVIPFTLGNLFYGVTPLRFGPYVAASALAMLPGTALHVMIGATGRRALTDGTTPIEIAYLAAGLVATAIALVWTALAAKRALRRRGAIVDS